MNTATARPERTANTPAQDGPALIDASYKIGTRLMYAAAALFILGAVASLIGRDTTEALINAGNTLGKIAGPILAAGILAAAASLIADRHHANKGQDQPA
jgi:hypothetical protein